jgi:hypothetical protein
MKRIFSILFAATMLVVVSSATMARPIMFVDTGADVSLSKEVDSDDHFTLAINGRIADQIITTAEITPHSGSYNLTIGFYECVFSNNFMVGFKWGDDYINGGDNINTTQTVDLRAHAHVSDNLTLACQLTSIETFYENDSPHEDKTYMLGQAEYQMGDFMLINIGASMTDYDDDNSDKAIVTGIEVAFTEKFRGFVDYDVAVDSDVHKDNKVTLGISLYASK